MPTLLDAWVLAWLMADQPVPAAELAAMSGTFRPLADLLAATPFSDRGRIFDFCLSGWPDRDAIVRAVADADPTRPPPAAGSAPPPCDWPPLSLEELPPVEPFPVDVLPDPAARLAERGSGRDRLPSGLPRGGDAGRGRGDHRPIGQLACSSPVTSLARPSSRATSARPRTGRRPP